MGYRFINATFNELNSMEATARQSDARHRVFRGQLQRERGERLDIRRYALVEKFFPLEEAQLAVK